jgi:protein-tyrosine phosphatase
MNVFNIWDREYLIPTYKQKLETSSKNEKEIKVASVFKRTVSSTLFWTALGDIAAVVFTFEAVAILPPGVPILAIGIIASAVFIGIAAIAIVKRKQLFYEISLAYNFINHIISPEKWPVYNKITDNLFLGRLPLKNRDDHRIMIDQENIGAVLSVVEYFENHSLGILSDPVVPEDWATLGIDHRQIETPDFCPLSVQNIERGVNFIEEEIKKGKKVYVHCKAGRSRSAAIIVSYLIKSKQFNTVEEAINYVKEKRSLISLKQSKIDSIKEYAKTISSPSYKEALFKILGDFMSLFFGNGTI